MHVSMRIVKKVPSREETVNSIQSMLNRFGYTKAIIVGHSLGTGSIPHDSFLTFFDFESLLSIYFLKFFIISYKNLRDFNEFSVIFLRNF